MNQGVLFNESDIAKLSPEQRAQIATQSGTPVRGRKPKQGRAMALDKATRIPRYDCRVCIRLTVYQKRNFDIDNSEAKSIVDALVANGVLQDDSIKEIPVFIREGKSVKTVQEERTVVELYEA